MSSSLSARYRTAFVTGASTGLGLAFTEMLLAAGVEVWGTARDAARLKIAHAGFHPVGLELGDGPAAERADEQAELDLLSAQGCKNPEVTKLTALNRYRSL